MNFLVIIFTIFEEGVWSTLFSDLSNKYIENHPKAQVPSFDEVA